MLNKFRLLIISLLFSTITLVVLYLVLRKIEFFQNLDKKDFSIFVPWLSQSFYVKNSFKFFYNLTIILFPLLIIGTSYLLRNKIKPEDRKLTSPNNYDFINKYFYKESKIIIVNKKLNYQYTGSNEKLKKAIPNLKIISYKEAIKDLYHYYQKNLGSLDKSAIIQDEYFSKSKIKNKTILSKYL